tara:strand:+ start:170 stop:505 length:336 start_codon:yes stop_codon:yes gene_type:complete
MTLWAKIEDNIVTNVIDVSGLKSGFIDTQEGTYIETSNSIRKWPAAIGMIYDSTRDAFYSPKRYPSWTLNESTCQWEAPLELPEDYDGTTPLVWNEDVYQGDNTKGWTHLE